MRLNNLSFTDPPSQANKCISQTELATLHNMSLTEETYAVLVHNIKQLSTLEQDPQTMALIKPYLKPRYNLSSLNAGGVEDGVVDYKCTTIASRKTARSNVTVSKGTGITFVIRM